MVKRLLFLLTFAILPTMAETHYMEAEDFLGNARVVSSRDASGGKYLEGSTWYVFVKGLPIPALKKELHVFARMRSALPAHWFLAYDSAKPFGWFKTESSEWHWVRIGSFTPGFVRENGGVFPQIFLQKPVNSTVERTDGAVDVLVFSEEKITSKELEGLFRESNQQRTKQVEPPQGAETPDGLADSHRICSAHLTNHPPVIDGKLDDAAWHGVSPLTGFICIGGRRFATQQTFVRICRDAENLYLGAELQESQMNLIRRLRTRRNDQIWTDDSFEVFIDPGLTQKKAYHFIVNPNGARQDDLKARIDEAGFAELRLDWEAATSLQESGWTVELKIPFRLLTFSEITPQSAWGINFCRSEIPLGEKSYWNNTGEYFYAPAKYGVMFFAQVPGGLQAIRMPMGENGMRLTFMPAQETSVTVSAEIHAGERHETFPAVIHEIGPGETTIQFPVQAYRQYRVLSRVTEGANSAEFSLVARHYAPGLHSALWPPEERDNSLPILPGTAQHAFLILGNHSSETFSELVAEISVPEGIVLLDPTTDVDYPFYRRCRLLESKAQDREEGRYTVHRIAIEGKLPPKDLRKCRFFEGITLFFQVADSALHNRRLPLFHRILATNAQEEEQRTVLEVLEPLEGRQPRRLTVHNWMWTFYPYGGCLKPYLETMRRIGVNSVEGGGAQSLDKNRLLFREHNLSLINNMYWHFNGAKQDGHRAIGYDGTPSKRGLYCPTALLANQGELLLLDRRKFIEDIRNGSDGVVWDLEGPNCWEICFCSKCLEAFRGFAGIPADQPLTPLKIREEHHREWIRFCCRQSTEVCRMMGENFRRLNPQAQFGFYSGLPCLDTMESYRADWEDAIGSIDLALLSYYANSTSVLDKTFNQDMKETLRHLRKQALPRHPRFWATLTPGYERNSAMAPPPELIQLEVLRAFASGMDGVSFWWWGPFDGRFYRSLAQATSIVAHFEDFFLAGELPNSFVFTPTEQGRWSSFTSKTTDGREFLLLLNHSSRPLAFTVSSSSGKKIRQWSAVQTGSDEKATLRVSLPAFAVVAFHTL